MNEHFNTDTWEASNEYWKEEETQYYDDISGAPLQIELVDHAIKEEMDEYKKHGVYKKDL